MGRYAGRPKKPKKSCRPKRLAMAEMAVQQMRTRGMNGSKKRSWVHLNEDDSEFMPTTQTIGSESYNVPMACVEVGTNGATIDNHFESTDILLGNIVIQNETI